MQKYFNRPTSWLCIATLFFSALLFACATKDPDGLGKTPQPRETPGTTVVPTAATSPSASNPPSREPIPTATPSPSLQPIQVSKEVFTQTFSQVEQLINKLNEIIKRKDYAAWTVFLSASYKSRMENPEFLKQMNQSATLQKNNIVLKSFEDFFNFVVVPSRANLRLDDLVFLTETEVEAIMVVGNRRVTLYRLIKIGEQWMIGLS